MQLSHIFVFTIIWYGSIEVNSDVPLDYKLDPSALTVVVVEYRPERGVDVNSEQYLKIIDNVRASTQEVDLVVFPEATLGYGIPKIDSASYVVVGETPCTNAMYPQYLRDISCAAAEVDSYVVINAVEKVKCDDSNTSSDNCKNYGHYLYNTDIVFDNAGDIVQKYNKYNLFGEFDLDRPSRGEPKTFSVKSKETFGIFTCFDMLFQEPAEHLVETGVKNVAFPSMWYSELPFATALQVQQMWAHAHDVILFASGANQPAVGSGGSGIYKGSQGPVVFDYVTKNTTTFEYFTYQSATDGDLLDVGDVGEIDAIAKDMDSFYLMVDNLTSYTSVLLDTVLPEDGNVATKVCHNSELCCQFEVKVSKSVEVAYESSSKTYTYHLVAYSGTRSYSGVYFGGIEVCALVACLDEDVRSCGSRFENQDEVGWPITFESITVSADFSHENATQYPNSLLSSIRPIHPKYTDWSDGIISGGKEGKLVVGRKFSLNEPQSRLMTFGIYGRKFSLDFDPTVKTQGGGAIRTKSSISIVHFILFINMFLFRFYYWKLV